MGEWWFLHAGFYCSSLETFEVNLLTVESSYCDEVLSGVTFTETSAGFCGGNLLPKTNDFEIFLSFLSSKFEMDEEIDSSDIEVLSRSPSMLFCFLFFFSFSYFFFHSRKRKTCIVYLTIPRDNV